MSSRLPAGHDPHVADPGIEVRPALREELLAVARVRVASWRAAYAGLVPDDELASIGEPERLQSWAERIATSTGVSVLVAVVDGDVVGFSAYGPERSDLVPAAPGRGEVYAIYVHPDAWGIGAGHALMSATVDALRAHGHDAVSLWVLQGNARGIAFYQRQRFTPTGEVAVSTHGDLPEARWARPTAG